MCGTLKIKMIVYTKSARQYTIDFCSQRQNHVVQLNGKKTLYGVVLQIKITRYGIN